MFNVQDVCFDETYTYGLDKASPNIHIPAGEDCVHPSAVVLPAKSHVSHHPIKIPQAHIPQQHESAAQWHNMEVDQQSPDPVMSEPIIDQQVSLEPVKAQIIDTQLHDLTGKPVGVSKHAGHTVHSHGQSLGNADCMDIDNDDPMDGLEHCLPGATHEIQAGVSIDDGDTMNDYVIEDALSTESIPVRTEDISLPDIFQPAEGTSISHPHGSYIFSVASSYS